ncbi:hypothetical protein EX895_006554 [Sporisorium graminicola]|uniref:Uncharacterized protein n=1 Tax=Sporisorium graminicola TaxID=280036 RepID=A0A4U7KNZ5_9BASI|nr:hypothetical protein EX895_006554 [Sporisorium graminicola]TKY84652.1 hypothetical protein EX895_006554 [Sporisorium graminicola]
MGLAQSRSFDPEGLYLHGTAPSVLPISVAAAVGPDFILVILCCFLCGANSSLYAVYLHLFGGRKGDPAILQLAVLVSVACNATQALYGALLYYYSDLIDLYTPLGFDMNKIEVYVVVFHALQALPEAIGQVYFALRIAKLFDHRRTVVRIVLGGVLFLVAVQAVLVNWFGVAFYSMGYKSRLLDEEKRGWVKGIISAWTVVFISLELSMTVTTLARLMVLRRKTTMDGARRVIFNLAVYSVQGQVLLTAYSMSSLYLFSRSATGWYTPLYLLSGSLYTLILLANLIYRSAVSSAMQKAQSSHEAAEHSQRSLRSHRDPPPNAVCSYSTEPVENLRLETRLPPPPSHNHSNGPDWWHSKEREEREDTESKAETGSMRSWQMEPVSNRPESDGRSFGQSLPPLSRRPSGSAKPTLPLVRINTKTSFRSFKQYHF